MNKKIYTPTIGILLIVLFNPLSVWSWNDKKTHPLLGEYASEISILGRDSGVFLKSLGFPGGLDEVINTDGQKLEIKKWIGLGERLEDAGSKMDMLVNKARFNNHFHIATKQKGDYRWLEAGLDDWTLFPFPVHSTGESSLLWAQDRERQKRFVGRDHTWQQARDDYYGALTGTSEEVRSEKFAAMFRTQGHQIHLIQDASVPSHTRNDAHAENSWPKVLKTFRFGLEWWAQVHLKDNIAKLKQFAPESSIPTVTVDLQASIPESHKSLGLHSPIQWNMADIRLLNRRKV
jgi:hypothetical protein